MRLISFSVLFLIVLSCFGSQSFAGLTKVQRKALASLNIENTNEKAEESSFEIFVLDQPGTDRSVAVVGVSYDRISKAEKKSLAHALAAFKTVYIQESDVHTPIDAELLQRSKSGRLMVIKKPIGSWFQSYLFPCSTVLSAMGTTAAMTMSYFSPDLSHVALITAGGALTYLNYKKWVNQSKRATIRKVLGFSQSIQQETTGQSLLVTDRASAFEFAAGLIAGNAFEEKEPPVCRPKRAAQAAAVAVELSPEDLEQERHRLELEAEQERIREEKLLRADEEKARAMKAREALDLQREKEEKVQRDWERSERERKKLEKKALKNQNW